MPNFFPIPPAPRRRLPWGIVLMGAMAIAPGLPLIAHAQSTPSGDATDLGEWQPNERDTRSIGATGLTPLELIQRFRSLSGQSQSEFNSQQNRRLDDAAESFRRQQQQQLGGSSPATTPTEDSSR